MKFDFIIIGQGLAGTLLAHDLIEANKTIAIIDVHITSAASPVAAGLINPVSMKRCIPSYNSYLYYPRAISRYRQIEKKIDSSFLKEKPILRVFSNDKVKNDWQTKYSNTNMDYYISRFYSKNKFSFLNNPHGSAEIHLSSQIDINKFLQSSRNFFKKNTVFLEERFDFSLFDVDQGIYKKLRSDNFIFCEGFRVKDNPYFNWLPIKPNKGELLTIRIPTIKCFDKVISQGVYIVPLDNYNYLVGSTYNHKDLTDGPTAQGKASLKDKLSDILSVGYEVVSCVSGIRPTVKDRKPLVGLHPIHSKIAVFNGLGTRGALQGPYLSDNFSKFLTTQSKNTQNAENQRITSFFDGKKSQINS